MGLRDTFGALFGAGARPQPAATRAYGAAPLAPPAYRAASGLSQELASYWPSITSGDSASLPNLRISLDRARDLVRNDPHAGAGVDRLVDMLVGDGWEVVPTPDYVALGIDREAAYAVGRQIRSEWKRFTRHPRKFCDARRRLTMDGVFRQAARTMATANEACVALKFRPEADGLRYQTAVALVDPDRLSNPGGRPDTRALRGGVEFDADGAPVAYHVRQAHVADYWDAARAMNWIRIQRETAEGRPVFVHAFEGDREDQTRAVTAFASLVSRLHMLGKFSDVELANATANALIAAHVETDMPAQEMADRLAAPSGAEDANIKAGWTAGLVNYFMKNPVSLGGVRIPVLPVGSKIRLNNAPRQTVAFSQFQTSFLRSIASRLGISYEQLSHDWSQVNYSSARAALNEVWRTVKRMQAVFAEQFVTPIYFAFLDEAFHKGYVTPPAGAPSFWDAPEAWCAARWIGPGRGYIDPTKEAEASAMRMVNLTSTLEAECAEQGVDHLDVLDQLEREKKELEARGLSRAPAQQKQAAQPETNSP